MPDTVLTDLLEDAGLHRFFSASQWQNLVERRIQLHDMPVTENLLRVTIPKIVAAVERSSFGQKGFHPTAYLEDIARSRRELKRVQQEEFDGIPLGNVRALAFGSLASSGRFAQPSQDSAVLEIYQDALREVECRLEPPPRLYLYESDLPTAYAGKMRSQPMIMLSTYHLLHSNAEELKTIFAHEIQECEEITLRPRATSAGAWLGALGYGKLNHAREERADARSLLSSGGGEAAAASLEKSQRRMDGITSPLLEVLNVIEKAAQQDMPGMMKKPMAKAFSAGASLLHPATHDRAAKLREKQEALDGWIDHHLQRADEIDSRKR